MPNHCFNSIAFDGNVSAVEILKDFISKDGGLDFNKIIPCPPQVYMGSLFADHESRFGENTWYEWNKKNWGTKWNAYDTEFDGNCVRFTTAWCPPNPIIVAIANLTKKNFTFYYEDDGEEWKGQDRWTLEGGNMEVKFDSEVES